MALLGPLQHARHLVSGKMQYRPPASRGRRDRVRARLPAGARAPDRRAPSRRPAPPHVSAALELKAEGDALMAKADYRGGRGGLSRVRRLSIPTTCRSASRSARPRPSSIRSARPSRRFAAWWRAATRPAWSTARPSGGSRRWVCPTALEPSARPGPPRAKTDAEAAATPEKLVGGRLVGRMEWPGIDPAVRAIRGEMWIHGAEASTESVKRSAPDQPGRQVPLLRHSPRAVPDHRDRSSSRRRT